MKAILRRHAAGWLVAWALLFWLWLLLAGEWSRVELVAAALAAALAASVGEVARTRADASVRVPLRWVARAASVPPLVVFDFGILVWALAESALRRRIRRGEFRTRAFPAGGADPTSRGLRAWVAVAATYSPNAYVIEIDTERKLVRLHDLVPRASSESPA